MTPPGTYSGYVVFVDESGDHSLESINPDWPLFVLSFCIFPVATYVNHVTPAIRALKFATWGHDLVVLHEHDIRKRKGAFTLLNKEARGAREDAELELEFRRVCDGANRTNRPLPLRIRIADKKTNSEGLQLADLTARPAGLSVLRPDQPNRAWSVLKMKLFAGRRGFVSGNGLKIFP